MSRPVDRLVWVGQEGFAELDKMLHAGQRRGRNSQGFQPQYQHRNNRVNQVPQDEETVAIITSTDAAKIYGGIEYKEFYGRIPVPSRFSIF